MSPEQRAGEGASETWDTWALTVIAFEMVTGVHPFGASGEPWGTPAGGWPVAVRSSDVALGPAVARYFERALATDRAGRPASVRDFVDDLEAALQLTC